MACPVPHVGCQGWGPGPELCFHLAHHWDTLDSTPSLRVRQGPRRVGASEQRCCFSLPLGLGPRPFPAFKDVARHGPAGLLGRAQPTFSAPEGQLPPWGSRLHYPQGRTGQLTPSLLCHGQVPLAAMCMSACEWEGAGEPDWLSIKGQGAMVQVKGRWTTLSHGGEGRVGIQGSWFSGRAWVLSRACLLVDLL